MLRIHVGSGHEAIHALEIEVEADAVRHAG